MSTKGLGENLIKGMEEAIDYIKHTGNMVDASKLGAIEALCKHPAATAFLRYMLEQMSSEEIDKMIESVTVNVKKGGDSKGDGPLEYWITKND